jgi:hypothetical protein
MRLLTKIIKGILVFFGVLFLIEVAVLAWFISADPFNLKPLWQLSVSQEDVMATSTDSMIESTDRHPLLNQQQEKTLENFGIDPAALPTEITPAMEECVIEKLGQERADQLAAGAEPNAFDFLKAGSCLSQN